jgi:hypothetical protein
VTTPSGRLEKPTGIWKRDTVHFAPRHDDCRRNRNPLASQDWLQWLNVKLMRAAAVMNDYGRDRQAIALMAIDCSGVKADGTRRVHGWNPSRALALVR